MVFKTTLADLNKVAVAIDKVSTMTLPDYKGLGVAIEGLTAKQAALVLSTRNLSQAELEEVVIQNDLISKYGAEQLIKSGLLTANSSLLVSEKTLNAEELQRFFTEKGLSEETAKRLVQENLKVIANGEETASVVVLNKALLDEAVKRGILTEEQEAEVLSSLGVVATDKLEIGSKKGLRTAILGVVAANAELIAVTAGFTALITVLYKTAKATEEVRQKAQELGSEFKDSKYNIESYKKQIEELYKTINDSGSSIEDVTNARKTLMSVQDELIDKFGTEKSVINDVTEAINGQTDALDRLTRSKWQEVKNDFNDGDFWNDIANFFQDTDNIERMLKEYGKKTISFKWADYVDINKLTDEMVAELENIGIDIRVSTDNLQGVRDFDSLTESISDTKGASLTITGNAEEIYNQILALQNLIGNDDSFDKLYNKLESTANSYKDLTDKYKDFYDQYILYEKVLTDDSEYADVFKNITSAYEEYSNAFTSGDPDKIKEATKQYANIVSNAMATALANGDEDVATYFENMYPTLKSIVSGWEFNVAFDANTDDLQTKVQSVLDELKDENGRQLTTEEILGLGEENQQYQDLVSIAHSYNMTLEEMIALLKERNLVADMDYQGLVNLFGQENIDSLSPEDIEIAYTIKNAGNMTFDQLLAEVQRVKDEANSDETPDVSLTISSTIEKLNTQLKPAFDSLKSAYQDIFTDDGFELNSIDILSTCDSIKSKLDEISKFNPDLDYSSFEDFVRVLSNTDSTTEDVKNAFNSLATSITNAALSGTEDFTTMKAALEDLGVVNNELVAFDALISNTEALKEAGLDLTNTTNDEIEAFVREMISAENCGQAIAMLTFQKELLNLQEMNTAAEVANLRTLAENAGYTGEVIQWLTELEQIYQTIASGVLGTNNQQVAMARQRAAELQNLIAESANNIEYKPKVDFDGIKKDASSAAKSASNSIKDSIDSYMNYMEKSLESGRISFQEYSRDVSAYLKQMYDSGKISAQDYFDYQKKMLETQKSIYDKVLSAVTRRIDKEIDKYEELIDAIKKENDALNAKKDEYDAILSVVESVYDKEIDRIKEQQDAIDDTIKKLRDENDETQRGIELEQARWNLYKAMTQRNVKLYNGKEYIYTTNRDEVRNAQQNLADLELEETISALEKERDALDESIDLLEEYKQKWFEIADAWEKAINEQLAIELFGEGYEQFILHNRITDIDAFKDKYLAIQDKIEDNTKLIESYHEKIEYYKKLKEQWQDIADAYEQSVEDQYAAMILGANWEADVLSGRVDVLNNFKDAYISIQQAIVDAAWNSANEQIKAAQAAASAQGGSNITGGGSGNDINPNSKNPNSSAPSGHHSTTSNILGSNTSDILKKKGGKKYHSGLNEGYVGDNPTNDQKLALLRYYSDDMHKDEVPAILQEGEVVLTPKQQDNILENLIPISQEELWESLIAKAGNGKYNKLTSTVSQNDDVTLPKLQQKDMLEFLANNMVMPDYSQMFGLKNMDALLNANKIETVNNSTPVVQDITITLPNVTNESGYEKLKSVINQLPLDAYQMAHRK